MKVSAAELRAEAGAIREKASAFETKLHARRDAVMRLKWRGVARRSFENMFTEAGEVFKETKKRLDGVATNLDLSAMTLERADQAAGDAAK